MTDLASRLRDYANNRGHMAMREAAANEIERLESRLEVYDVTGKYKMPECADGIACRDETIKLLDERVESLRAENEKNKKWFDDNGANLANHRIGGFKLGEFTESKQDEVIVT